MNLCRYEIREVRGELVEGVGRKSNKRFVFTFMASNPQEETNASTLTGRGVRRAPCGLPWFRSKALCA